ncbi:MAG: CopG family transcriptional regulator [Chloroflexota bacterium]
MRTTLDVDDDVLLAARELARQRGISLGKAVSDLARRGFPRPDELNVRNGMPLLPVKSPGTVVTLELVNQLRDDEP